MKNENKKYVAVIRVRNSTTGIIVERGFVDMDEAEDEYLFLNGVCDDVEIFDRTDWEAGIPMELNTEYWFGNGEA